jgi:hypothetical protein
MVYKDCRDVHNRKEYFYKLYDMSLRYKIMPGLVYLYMPQLVERNSWEPEQALWFAFINGLTQNPITSRIIFNQLPVEQMHSKSALQRFTEWFNENWEQLSFDTDRRYQKKDTPQAIETYCNLVREHGSQVSLFSDKSYRELWSLVNDQLLSFGRLSTFSYLEYVYLNGYGADCTNLMFEDKSGSRSHRNGMLLLEGQDSLVNDKRVSWPTEEPSNFAKMCLELTLRADHYIASWSNIGASRFTFESALCTFKNHFFGRRYPGVYADMAWQRICWYEPTKFKSVLEEFKDIRTMLPDWLREECEIKPALTLKQKAQLFPKTGFPYRGENFI